MNCSFCDKTFANKYVLKTHIECNKKCIAGRGLDIPQNYVCKSCTHISTRHNDFQVHLSNCSKYTVDLQKEIYEKNLQEIQQKYQEKLKDKDEYIAKLEARIDKFEKTISEIALQPKSTTTNTTNTNNMTIMGRFDINDTKQIGDVIQKYLTKDVVARGQEGVAVMLCEHLLKGPNGESLYDCTDVSRQSFEFINVDGNIETDPKATKLIRSIGKSGLSIQANVAADKLWSKEDGKMDHEKYGIYADKVTEVMQLEKDSAKLRNKLASVMARPRRGRKKE
jgi:hypothetical protein